MHQKYNMNYLFIRLYLGTFIKIDLFHINTDLIKRKDHSYQNNLYLIIFDPESIFLICFRIQLSFHLVQL